LNTKAF